MKIDAYSVTLYTDKLYLIYKEFRRDRVQIHIWPTASSYITKYLRFSSYIRKPYLIYDFAPDPICISLSMRKVVFSFLSVFGKLLSALRKSLTRLSHPDPEEFSSNFSPIFLYRFTCLGICIKFFLSYTDKKENQIFLIHKAIQSGAVVKSYMTNGLLIYGEMLAHFLIY